MCSNDMPFRLRRYLNRRPSIDQMENLDDGSYFTEIKVPDLAHVAERCWPTDRDFTCIRVVDGESEESRMKYVEIQNREELPDRSNLSAEFPAGYSCRSGYFVSESVWDRTYKNEEINTLGGKSPSPEWSRQDVETKLSKMAVDGPGYFNCIDILQLTGPTPSNLASDNITRDNAGFR